MQLFSKNKTVNINITTESILTVMATVVGLAVLYFFVSNVAHQLRLILIAAFLALAINPAVTKLTTYFKLKSRMLATGIAYLIVIGVLAFFMTLVVPPLVRQTSDFIQNFPETVEDFRSQDSSLSRLVQKYNIDEQLEHIGSDISKRFAADDLAQPVLTTAGRIGGIILSLVTILVLAFMMLVEGPIWLKRIWALQPAEKREHRKKIATKMYRVVTGYVNGQVLISAIGATFAAVALFIGSSVADVSVNAIALAGIIFLFGLIPLIGNTIGAAIVVVITLFSSVGLAVAIAAFFLLYQQIENVSIQPYIQAKTNQLTPLIVFVAAILGAGFGGILGAFAAIPIAGCIKILAEEYISNHFPTQTEVAEAHK